MWFSLLSISQSCFNVFSPVDCSCLRPFVSIVVTLPKNNSNISWKDIAGFGTHWDCCSWFVHGMSLLQIFWILFWWRVHGFSHIFLYLWYHFLENWCHFYGNLVEVWWKFGGSLVAVSKLTFTSKRKDLNCHQTSTKLPPNFHQTSTELPPNFHQNATKMSPNFTQKNTATSKKNTNVPPSMFQKLNSAQWDFKIQKTIVYLFLWDHRLCEYKGDAFIFMPSMLLALQHAHAVAIWCGDFIY